MNQGRIWCVVSPTVGLPLFLGAVAVTSLIVHASIMTHTTWMSSYWMGSKAKVAMDGTAPGQAATAAAKVDGAFSMTLTPVPATGTTPASFVITVNPATGTKMAQPVTGQQALATPANDTASTVSLQAANTKTAE